MNILQLRYCQIDELDPIEYSIFSQQLYETQK